MSKTSSIIELTNVGVLHLNITWCVIASESKFVGVFYILSACPPPVFDPTLSLF